MAQKILGIDLGTHSLKLALIERTFNDYRVTKLVEQPLTLQARLPHEEAVLMALQHVLEEHDFQADVVSAGYPGHFISNRLLELPFTNSKKIAQVIEFELEGHIPFDIEDLLYDFHIVEKKEAAAKILCAYLNSEKFGGYLEALGKAGIDPKYFGSDAIDLAAIAQVAMVPQDLLYALVDVGHSKTNVCLMKGRDLLYVRTIGIGGLHFTRAIQRAFNVNFEKAESLKLTRGKLYIRESETDQISRLLSHVAGELVSGIKQTFLGYESTVAREAVAALYVTGGGAKLSGLLDFFSFHLRTNVLELDGLGSVPHNLEDTAEASHIMTQAVANALRPIFTNRLPKINFRKGQYAFKQDLQVLTGELKYAAAMAGVILTLALAYFFYNGHYYAQKKESVNRGVARLLERDYRDFWEQIKPPGARARASGGLDINAALVKRAEGKLKTLSSQTASLTGGGAAGPGRYATDRRRPAAEEGYEPGVHRVQLQRQLRAYQRRDQRPGERAQSGLQPQKGPFGRECDRHRSQTPTG